MRVLRFLRFFGILKKQRKSVKVLTFQKLFPVSRQKTEDIVIFKGVRSSLQSHLLWVNVYSVHHRAYSLAHLQWSIRWRLRLCMYKIIYLSNKNLAETSSGQTTRSPKYVVSADIVHTFGGKEQPQLYKDIHTQWKFVETWWIYFLDTMTGAQYA